MEANGQNLTVTIGYDLAGVPREVFASGPKEGSDVLHVLSDACVVISIALQHGITAAGLARSMGTVPDWSGKPVPASVIGVLVDLLVNADALKTP